eukprot:CAMPEP_0179888544 /NCGR_PEP_ID=MMETSP0982-20121206/32027_1 /TAXON_ID=483367 /ORGANISM="non described non described, Strain CCMP 2436" /LENGTH=51 /DNA_ID=CAMNT_0021784511 /DNA_START=941 /DNA_END=1096 /DNA_ORIENTATION=-
MPAQAAAPQHEPRQPDIKPPIDQEEFAQGDMSNIPLLRRTSAGLTLQVLKV